MTPLVVPRLAAMKTVITWWSLVLAFGISGAVGIIFGLYPASGAAALQPIKALRFRITFAPRRSVRSRVDWSLCGIQSFQHRAKGGQPRCRNAGFLRPAQRFKEHA